MEIFKDFTLLVILVVMVRKRIQMGHTLFTIAVLLGLVHYVSPLKLGSLLFTTLSSKATLTIFAALFFISIMENTMRTSGAQSRLVSGLKNISGDTRITLATLPAIFGLLPSPGGARFSAPMVEEAASGLEINSEQKAAINYWYRHIWEYFLPLYPANLLTIELLNIPLNKFVLVQIPFTLVTLVTGYLFLKDIQTEKGSSLKTFDKHAWFQVLEGLAPIILIMVVVLVFEINIILATLFVCLALLFYYRIESQELPAIIKHAFNYRMFYMVFSALYLRDVLLASGRIDALMDYFNYLGLTPMMIAIIFPFTIGLLTGQTIPGLSIALPIIVSMASPENLISLGSLAFVSNFAGHMLSPMHLCLILSLEHFSADFGKTHLKLLIPDGLVFLFGIFYYYLIQ